MKEDLKDYLDSKVEKYNRVEFIDNDPIVIPHGFTVLQDIEISGFFAAILAWGLRKTIIKKCNELMQRMDNSPFDFVCHSSDNDLKQLMGFKHRTFNDTDLLYSIDFLKRHYAEYNSLESAFTKSSDEIVLNYFSCCYLL